MTTAIRIPVETHSLGAIWSEGRESSGVVLAHPHPLYGGTMDNPVVLAAERAFQAAGWHTLRFDFRGSGESTGTHDDGIGEMRDLVAACDFLESRVGRLAVCGYSFGAWIATSAIAHGLLCERLHLIAPPLDFLPFSDRLGMPVLAQVVAASADSYCAVHRVREAASRWNPDATLDLIDGADHFFTGCEAEVTTRIFEALQSA